MCQSGAREKIGSNIKVSRIYHSKRIYYSFLSSNTQKHLMKLVEYIWDACNISVPSRRLEGRHWKNVEKLTLSVEKLPIVGQKNVGKPGTYLSGSLPRLNLSVRLWPGISLRKLAGTNIFFIFPSPRRRRSKSFSSKRWQSPSVMQGQTRNSNSQSSIRRWKMQNSPCTLCTFSIMQRK